ncbi:FAM172 family protein homolog Y75B8A.31 [Caenorhabditis elegans]|uniref:FAM172 family protein homolog Y75B8A.31 n=1 Tax=Caenorhabditis elegans TaxID=6239 RepID=F172A_CAEEL|nr:FAM172 family protein homolog Y75B8A.31 [Caenorhabditis elegans]Q9XW78.1 RecName: Full=FAM172 family protein homolog Y75B8A.31 [Caenorhabditis elegans]CAA22091.1 FAM172 family protein homolog Y75B8A.31 [Caenorhabditis elegans]|eukprot:NP_499604.1 FAM172 family protein homolog Y75B8A.31 [Caenorhabditis elegans]
MSSLAKLGYFFDEKGVLKTEKDKKPFKFTTQEDYEELGEAVDLEVYELLETRCGLKRKALKLPGKTDEDEDLSFIFVSKNFKKAANLLVLIHGSGVVRAGQWARRLIINDNLECGTQIPYIERAIENGWGVVVMNTNLNESKDQDLKYSRTPVEHAETVWIACIEPSNAKSIYVVAHSRGGYDTASVLKKFGGDDRISKICLTDSPWFEFPKSCAQRARPLFVVNFLAHGALNSPSYKVREYREGNVAELWAGTQIHEWSSHCAIDAVFHILETEMTPSNYAEVMEEAKKLVVKSENSKESDDEAPKSKKICV